jgi:hypothetical protein
MAQGFGVRDSTEVVWLNRTRYIAHQFYVEGIVGATLEEQEQSAAAGWLRDVRNLDIARRGTGPDTQLGVVGVARTEGFFAHVGHGARSLALTRFIPHHVWRLP